MGSRRQEPALRRVRGDGKPADAEVDIARQLVEPLPSCAERRAVHGIAIERVSLGDDDATGTAAEFAEAIEPAEPLSERRLTAGRPACARTASRRRPLRTT